MRRQRVPRRRTRRPRQRLALCRSSTSRRIRAAAGRRAASARRWRRCGRAPRPGRTSRRSTIAHVRRRRRRSPRSPARRPRRRSTTSSGRSPPPLATGAFTVGDVLGPSDDAGVAGSSSARDVAIDPELTARFPARRLTGLVVALRDGAASPRRGRGRGEPGADDWAEVVGDKVARVPRRRRRAARAGAGNGAGRRGGGPLARGTGVAAGIRAGHRRRRRRSTAGQTQRPEQRARLDAIAGDGRGVRERAAANVRPRAAFPAENFAELRRVGLVGADAGEADGGGGLWSEGASRRTTRCSRRWRVRGLVDGAADPGPLARARASSPGTRPTRSSGSATSSRSCRGGQLLASVGSETAPDAACRRASTPRS